MEGNSLEKMCADVRDHYLASLPQLSVQKQFHFLSRAYLWTRKAEYYEKLLSIRTVWWERFPRVCARLALIAPDASRNPLVKGKKYRLPYIEAYRDIGAYNRFFFMCLFDSTIFNGKAFEENITILDRAHHRALYEKLLHDMEALHILSTTAVNFLLLSHHFFPELPSPSHSLRTALTHKVEISPLDNADATVYFAHHVIIGVSLFYSRDISNEDMPLCTEMLAISEEIIDTSYDEMSLDHKCELLVCAAMLNHESRLEERIKEELLSSQAPHAPYFINTLNAHRKAETPSLGNKEHTNILALMAYLGRESL